MKFLNAILVVLISTSVTVLAGCTNCDSLQEEAERLLRRNQRCEAGDSCIVVNMRLVVDYDDSCLNEFQCAKPLNANADLKKLGKKARDLEKKYARCRDCETYSCQPITEAYCDELNGLCKAEYDYGYSDSDGDSDYSDSDSDSDTDSDSDSDSDFDFTDTDVDGDTDSDTDADSDTVMDSGVTPDSGVDAG